MQNSIDEKANLLYAFCLSIVFLIIDYAALTLLTEPLYRYLSLGNVLLSNIFHMLIISLVGTGFGCLSFLAFREKRKLVPMAYCFFPVYMIICYLFVIISVEPEMKSLGFRLVTLYTLLPTITGIVLSRWIYDRLKK